MNFDAPTLLEECQALLRNLNGISTERGNTSESFADFLSTFSGALSQIGHNVSPETSHERIAKAMPKLAAHADDALNSEPEYFTDLMLVLAAATRNSSTWRHYFGVLDSDYKFMLDDESGTVLEVARRVTTLNYVVTSRSIEFALKLIANICANRNENRSLIIHRGGVYLLLRLSLHQVTLDILIPALYNVCIDFDEPATSLDPINSCADVEDPSILEESSEHERKPPSLAVEHLAAAYSSAPNFSTFELLLSFGSGSRVESIIMPFLSDLVNMSVQPALSGFEKVRSLDGEPWDWTCSIDGVEYDTVKLVIEFAHRSGESLMSVCQAVLNILSLEEARDALFRREDASLWFLMNIPNMGWSAEDDTFDEDPDLTEIQKAFLKRLYEITGDTSFSCTGKRTSALIHECAKQLVSYTSYLQSGGSQHDAMASDRNEPRLSASTCVIISQLAATEQVRDELLANGELLAAIIAILESETDPDILYPAVTIISRISLIRHQDLSFIKTGTLSRLQRLLTAKGLGLIVPFETVAAYRTIIRNRPKTIALLLEEERQGTAFVTASLFRLFDLTVQATTKLEIAKFFLELLRTLLQSSDSSTSNSTSAEPTSSARPQQSRPHPQFFSHFLTTSSSHLVEIFTWLLLNADPPTQRHHAWFCFAMLSTWPQQQAEIVGALEEKQELRDAVLAAAESSDQAVRGNLRVLVGRLLELLTTAEEGERTAEVLRIVGMKLNLVGAGSELDGDRVG